MKFLIVYDWMTTKLKLSGNELLAYALIYSFAKDGKSEFHGTSGYIAKVLNMSERTTFRTLNALTGKGFVQKRAVGKYCNYAIPNPAGAEFAPEPVQEPPSTPVKMAEVSMPECHITPVKMAEVSMPECHITPVKMAEVSMPECHITPVKMADHSSSDINIDINKDIKSSSSDDSTTTTLLFLCKEAGFSLDKKKAAEILSSGFDPAWLDGTFTYTDYIAEIIQENYGDKPLEQKRKLFRTILAADDRKQDFPKWRKEREAEAASRREREAAAEEKRRRIDQARANVPKTCRHCGASLATDSERGNCPQCGSFFYFSENDESYFFMPKRSLSSALSDYVKNKRHAAVEAYGT